MIETHFRSNDILTMLLGFGFIFSSILVFLKGRIKLGLLFLSVGGFILRFFIIKLDPFIYTWDEEFHALVAKNMMTGPLKPMLYANPVLPYAVSNWCCNHVWLHKGPVFLWLIAISLKFFGANEIALRLPSIIMSTLMIVLLFRMGKLLVNRSVGYFAAFLFATANYQLEMCSGIIPSDHNDVAFMFFVCASFWAWIEYQSSGKIYWIIIIGLFSGLAVDTKWIMGFLVFFCWLLTVILDSEKRKQWHSYKDLLKSFLIALFVSASWYVYALIRFPAEMVATFKSYSDTFFTVVENHSGGWYFHLDLLSVHYGWIVPFVLLLCFYFFYKTLGKRNNFKILLVSWFLFVEIFYAFAQTKMPLFTIIVAPVVYLSVGNGLLLAVEYFSMKIERFRMPILLVCIVLIGFYNTGIGEIEGHHTNTGLMVYQREKYIHNAAIFRDVAKKLPQKDYTIFNCKDFNAVQLMFYSGITSYDYIPDSIICSNLKKSGIKIAVFDDGRLPSYIAKDNTILKLDYKIMRDSLPVNN